MNHALDGLSMRSAIVTDFRVPAPDTMLGEATHYLLAGSQREFPVLRGFTLAGTLPQQRLSAGLRTAVGEALVTDYMETSFVSATPDEPLNRTLAQLAPEGCTTAAVFERGGLVGLVMVENVGELFMLGSALAARARTTPPPLPHRLLAPTDSRRRVPGLT